MTYYWRHEGHVPGSLDDLVSAPLPLPVKEALATLVDESLTWQNIKNAIRVDRATLKRIIGGNFEDVPMAMRINYHEVYHQMSLSVNSKARLDKDMQASLRAWSAKIAEDDGHSFFDDDLQCEELGAFSFAFMGGWQYEVQSRF